MYKIDLRRCVCIFVCVCFGFFFVLLEASINVFPTSVSKHVIKVSIPFKSRLDEM